MLKLENLSKYYYNKGMITSGLANINLEFFLNEFVVITGESGSGKSTLLNVLAGLDNYQEGEMSINGQKTSYFSQKETEDYRKTYIGDIFQSFNLVNSYTVYQNLELALLCNGRKATTSRQSINAVIEQVGLADFKHTRVSHLSGGQKQRVAIGRVLVRKTPVILADEPTGNLDQTAAREIIELLAAIAENRLVIVVSHDREQLTPYATRRITLSDGKVLEDISLATPKKAELPGEQLPRQLSLAGKIRLGWRNAFGLLSKLLLTLLVFMVLIGGSLGLYGAYRYQKTAEARYGWNEFFQENSELRIVVNKADRSSFTVDELAAIKKIPQVDKVAENDMALDLTADLRLADTYYSCRLADNPRFSGTLFQGRAPQNDNEILLSVPDWFKEYNDISAWIGRKTDVNVWQLGGSLPFAETPVIVGVASNAESSSDLTAYFSPAYLLLITNRINSSVSKIETKLNGMIYTSENNYPYFGVFPSAKVPPGQVYVSTEMNMYCKNQKCKNQKVSFAISNLYYQDSLKAKITKVIKTKNLRKYFGLDVNWTDYQNTFFISPRDYELLFDRPSYQISVFAQDEKTVDEVADRLAELGYNTLKIRDTVFNGYGSTVVFLNIFRTMVTALFATALFLSSYFIVRLIMRSRQTYYAIVRILGGDQKAVNQLVVIELLMVGNLAYLALLAIVTADRYKILDLGILSKTLGYLNLGDWLIMYGIAGILIIALAARVAKTLFGATALQVYAGGAQQ